jgi:copper resistance protein B
MAVLALGVFAFDTTSARSEPLIWGVRAEQVELRIDDGEDVFAWDADALVGTDEVKFVWRSTAEYLTDSSQFETLENQARLQMPISDFFDAVAGVRLDTPKGEDRVYGVIGLHGLAPQWFEVDADLYLGEASSIRFEAEYEGLITNHVILTPSLELDLPLNDDEQLGVGAFAPKLELGARLSYDLIDRTVSPYIGVHYERSFGETGNLARAEGESRDNLFFVVGTKVLF